MPPTSTAKNHMPHFTPVLLSFCLAVAVFRTDFSLDGTTQSFSEKCVELFPFGSTSSFA
jgi:hypothetical protein